MPPWANGPWTQAGLRVHSWVGATSHGRCGFFASVRRLSDHHSCTQTSIFLASLSLSLSLSTPFHCRNRDRDFSRRTADCDRLLRRQAPGRRRRDRVHACRRCGARGRRGRRAPLEVRPPGRFAANFAQSRGSHTGSRVILSSTRTLKTGCVPAQPVSLGRRRIGHVCLRLR